MHIPRTAHQERAVKRQIVYNTLQIGKWRRTPAADKDWWLPGMLSSSWAEAEGHTSDCVSFSLLRMGNDNYKWENELKLVTTLLNTCIHFHLFVSLNLHVCICLWLSQTEAHPVLHPDPSLTCERTSHPFSCFLLFQVPDKIYTHDWVYMEYKNSLM